MRRLVVVEHQVQDDAGREGGEDIVAAISVPHPMITAGRTVQTVPVPIVHNDMPARVVVEPLTTTEPTKLIPVIAIGTSTSAKLAPIGPVVPPVHAPTDAIALAVALAITLAIALAVYLAVDLPIKLTVDLAFDPVSAIETASGRLGDRGSSADQRYGQSRSDDLAHPHCLSPFPCRVPNGYGLYASSTLGGSWGRATEPVLTRIVRIRSGSKSQVIYWFF